MAKDIYKFLNTQQREAVDTIDGPVLVIARPGTGKTQLLSLRAANILEKTDALPQNILCLTYTEVGARNMRERIASFIGQAAYDIKISTYHGFGSEIIRENNEYFLEYGDSQPIDKLGQYDIMDGVYDNLSSRNILWRKETYLKHTLAMISQAKRANLSPENLKTIAENNLEYINNVNKIISKNLDGVDRINKSTAINFEKLFVELNNYEENQKLPNDILTLSDQIKTSFALAIRDYNESGKTPPITKWKTQWLLKDSADHWQLKGSLESNKVLALAEIYQKYNDQLAKQHLFDYDDMIIRAVEGLKKHDELRFNLQEKYQYIMLDEFQDTNLAQLELIELLTNNLSSHGRPNVLAVGDDDQAIYSFQGADLTNMVRFKNFYKDTKVITLVENWRSHQDILDISQSISGQIEERLHSTLGIGQKELIAKNPNIKSANVERLNFNSDIAELAWVADQIDSEIKNGVKASEIAVLAPRHKYLEPLLPYLNNHKIPIRYDKRENVFEDSRITDLIYMSELVIALSNNDSKTADSIWPIVLSGGHWGLSTSQIWQLSWQANNAIRNGESADWHQLMMQDESLKNIALFFAKLAIFSGSSTLEQMLDYLIGAEELELNEPDLKTYNSPYFKHYFGENTKKDSHAYQSLLSNLTVLRHKLRDYKNNESDALKLNDLLEFYNSYQRAGEKLLNTSPYHGADDAVQLLTAYGSKGLEFNTVFLLASLDDVWGMKAHGNNNKISLPNNLQIIKQAGQTKDERKRLFFVALSRAKSTVYITSHSQNFSGKQMSWLEFLNEAESEGVVSSPLIPNNKSVNNPDITPPNIQQLENFWHTNHTSGIANPELKALLKPRLENFQLSATDLNHFTDLIYAGPESFLLHKLLKFPKGPSVDGQYGNAMHETLEACLNIFKKEDELPDTDQIQDIFTKKLSSKKMPKQDFKRQLEKGKHALEVFIPYWWPNFSKSSQAEVSFRNEGCFVGDAHLAGNLDQLIIDYEEKTVEVVDFKTGKPAGKWSSSDAKLHKYKQQLLFYEILLNTSHTFKDFDATSGRITYLEPDEEGKIHELDLNYSEETEAIDRTKNLIKAVNYCITNLIFPDATEYSKSAKGIRDFESYLIDKYS